MIRKIIIFSFFGVLACQPKKLEINELAFYFWKTNFRILPSEAAMLDSTDCQKLFVKFLDIGLNPLTGAPEPMAILKMQDTAFLANKKVVPCVFITNETFKDLRPDDTEHLALNTAQLLRSIGQFFPINPFLQEQAEIQFDCDWSPSTRANYFLFLQNIKKHLPKQCSYSATIRLHQFKYPTQTGIPPVERGMLMIYNTDDIENWDTENSIFTASTADAYFSRQRQYPLPLDAAFPIFSWAIVFRDGDFWKILPQKTTLHFADKKLFKPLSNNRFEVIEASFQSGIFLRSGDQIRVEQISRETLFEMRKYWNILPNQTFSTCAFFHLDSSEIAAFHASDFTFATFPK